MPKSKPNKVVHLTQVKKKGKDHKQDLLRQLEEYGEKFERVYLFDFEQTKSDRIMLLRTRLKEHGRIFSGKNSLVSLALRNLGSKSRTNYDDLIKQVSGHRGLLFTDLVADKLIDLLTDELPEFRAKLLGCADLKRPAIARSDDDDDDDDQDCAEFCSEENTADEQEDQSSDDKEEGEESNDDDDDGDVEMTSKKSRGKVAAARGHRAGDRYTVKQQKENQRKDKKKRQMRLKIESKKQRMRLAKTRTKQASKSAAVSDPAASEAVGEASDKSKKMIKLKKSRQASPGETVAPGGDAADAGVASESAEVSRKQKKKKKSGKQRRGRHEVRFESLR